MSFWQELRKPIAALAPMEDVTDTVFRRIVARHGRPDVFFTEFTSVEGLFSPGREGVIRRLKFTEEERPVGLQLFGEAWSEPRLIALAYAYERATHHRRPPMTTPAFTR